MATDISISTVTAGKKSFYQFDITVDGKPTQVYSTSDKSKAEMFLVSQQEFATPADTLNGGTPGSLLSPPDNVFGPTKSPQYGATPAPAGGPSDDVLEARLSRDQMLKDNPDVSALGSAASGKKPLPPNKLRKLARDYCNLGKDEKKIINALTKVQVEQVGGTFGKVRKQTKCKRLSLPCELELGRNVDGNAFIILGNDRSGPPHSGNGGKGHTQCDAIDIVAGLGGFCPVGDEPATITQSDGEPTQLGGFGTETNPNFFVDAARIYISQKTDVDKNFGIGEEFAAGQVSEATEIGKYGAKSAIAAKADNIRLIGRESLRLVTGTDKFNSQGGLISGKHGIELVAMNRIKDLQPLVLGDNLSLCLASIVKDIEAIAGIFQAYVHYQQKFNTAVMNHNHKSPFYAIDTLPSAMAIAGGIQLQCETLTNTELSIIKHITNLQGTVANFLVDSGDSYINSGLNKTN